MSLHMSGSREGEAAASKKPAKALGQSISLNLCKSIKEEEAIRASSRIPQSPTAYTGVSLPYLGSAPF
ncbi:hypothetical protein A6R68_18073 [Neotoma lepida]|uniref:Uncharacterized protein n=1 Tax=Neotoma lepida TaxID=56216 RepID=A0A1A6HLX2_NEOLE|nr:hypothetical protein A6R68_18073 [Neotoma lepida]